MERLTKRLDCGRVAIFSAEDGEEYIPQAVLFRDAVDRLAAYEDTGLTPGEFHAYWVFFEDLIGNQKASEALDWFRQILNAEQAGRLVVLPEGDDTAALAATIDSTDMFRVCCGGDSDLLLGMLSILADEVAKKAGTTYRTLLMSMMDVPQAKDIIKEGLGRTKGACGDD